MADDDSRSGGRYAKADIMTFLDDLHAPHDAALRNAFEAAEREGMPAIQVSRSEARFVELLLRIAGAKRVVEVGTLAGFSGLRILKALPADGHLWTLEFDPKHAAVARRNFALGGFEERVTVVEGAALETLPTVSAHGPFDAVFLDADKANYPRYAAWAAENVRPGGLLLADNSYYFGKLLDADNEGAREVRRMHEEAREAFDTVCVPTPDGMLLGIRR